MVFFFSNETIYIYLALIAHWIQEMYLRMEVKEAVDLKQLCQNFQKKQTIWCKNHAFKSIPFKS